MKSIDTLVADIYDLFSSDYIPTDIVVSAFGEKLANKVAQRVSEERSNGSLRISNLGTPCRRQLYYKVKTPEIAERQSQELRMKFLIGDILEETLLFLAKEAGHTVEGEQDAIELSGVPGHFDAIIDGVPIDVKSASSFSFSHFAKHLTHDEDAFGYITQLKSYVTALQDDPRVTVKNVGAFLVIDKTKGLICLDKHEFPTWNYHEYIYRTRKMLEHPSPPPRGFDPEPEGKSGNLKLGVNCEYCPFKFECYRGLRAFKYSHGTTFLTRVVREPLVPEVTEEYL